MKNFRHPLWWLFVFSVAMGYLETAVVVDLRALYYPNGFAFPLVPIPERIALTEAWRELATMIMLAGIGIVAGRNATERFAFFLFCFAIWDLCYYIFLHVILGWPTSVFTWDILFLLPIPWVGPVLAPCIISLTMIAYALVVVGAQRRNKKGNPERREIILLLAGALLALVSFLWDYVQWTSVHPGGNDLHSKELFGDMKQYVPQYFHWEIFLGGELLMLLGLISMIRRYGIFSQKNKND